MTNIMNLLEDNDRHKLFVNQYSKLSTNQKAYIDMRNIVRMSDQFLQCKLQGIILNTKLDPHV